MANKTLLLEKDNFDFSPENIYRLAIDTGFTELSVQAAHTFAVSNLPWHHRNPFDRLLIAQAMSLPAYLLTSDGQLHRYSELVQTVAIH